MLFTLYCTDRPASMELRTSTRPEHLVYLESQAKQLMGAGALLDPEGNPAGSLFIVDVADRRAAEDFIAGDPFSRAGLFETVRIHQFRQAYKDGAKLG